MIIHNRVVRCGCKLTPSPFAVLMRAIIMMRFMLAVYVFCLLLCVVLPLVSAGISQSLHKSRGFELCTTFTLYMLMGWKGYYIKLAKPHGFARVVFYFNFFISTFLNKISILPELIYVCIISIIVFNFTIYKNVSLVHA